MTHKPLKATDKRRSGNSGKKVHDAKSDDESSGAGTPLANLFNDRRRPNGHGHRAK
jgi:hypothetical protein